jgi:hypothetical protein
MSTEKDNPDENEIELNAFEAALASLTPRHDSLDRDRLMFLAGAQSRTDIQSVEKTPSLVKKHIWPAAFSAMTCVSLVLAILLVVRPSNSTIVVEETRHSSPTSGKPTPPTTSPSETKGSDAPMMPERNFSEQTERRSPWIAYLQSLIILPATEVPVMTGVSIPDASAHSYSQMLDRLLRNQPDPRQVAQGVSLENSRRIREPATSRELLKEYLPKM